EQQRSQWRQIASDSLKRFVFATKHASEPAWFARPRAILTHLLGRANLAGREGACVTILRVSAAPAIDSALQAKAKEYARVRRRLLVVDLTVKTAWTAA